MSRTLFRLEVPQAVRDENLNGQELTRRGFAVNKFAAASTTPAIVADSFVDGAVDLATQAGWSINNDRTIVITNGTTPLPEGEFTFVGWKIIIGDGTTAGNLHIPFDEDNRNYHFYNCNIEVRTLAAVAGSVAFSIGYGQGGGADGTRTRADDQYGATADVTRGINSYGSLWIIGRDAGNRPIRFADFIDSEIIWEAGVAVFDSSGNGRQIRSTFNKFQGVAQRMRGYGNTITEGSTYNNFFFRHGNTGPNQPSQLVLDRPRFLPTGTADRQDSAIDLNAPGEVANDINNNIPGVTIDDRSMPVQLIGGPSIGADAEDALGVVTQEGGLRALRGGVVSSDTVTSCYSGINQYYGVGDRYFADGAQTVGAQGIRVRIDGTITQTQ